MSTLTSRWFLMILCLFFSKSTTDDPSGFPKELTPQLKPSSLTQTPRRSRHADPPANGLRGLKPSSAGRAFANPTNSEAIPTWAVRHGREFWTKRRRPPHDRESTTALDLPGIIDRVKHAFKHDPTSGSSIVDSKDYLLTLNREDVTFHPKHPRAPIDATTADAQFRFSTRSVSLGKHRITPSPERMAPVVVGNTAQRLLSKELGLVEHLQANANGLEITWLLHERPSELGDLEIEVTTSGLAYVTQTSQGAHYADALGHPRVRLGETTAVDSNLTIAAIPTEVFQTGFSIEIPEALLAQAVYPLAIDPLISPEFGLDQPVVRPSKDPQFTPSVASSGETTIVVWSESDTIYGTRVNSEGQLLDPGGLLVDSGSTNKRTPAVASNGTNFFTVWVDGSQESDLHGRQINADTGALLGKNSIVITDAAGKQNAPAIASNGSDYLIVWQDFQNQLTDKKRDLYGMRVSGNGQLMDAAPLIVISEFEDQNNPALATGAGHWVVVWSDFRTGIDFDVYGIRIAFDGQIEEGSAFEIATEPGNQWNVAIANSNDEYLVVWQTEGSESGRDIMGTRIDLLGNRLGPQALVLSDSSHDQIRPAVGANESEYFVVWEDQRNSAEFSNTDLYGTRLHKDGTIGHPDGLPISSAAMDQKAPRIVSDEVGHFVVWEDSRSGTDNDIYGTRIPTEFTSTEPIEAAPLSVKSNQQSAPAVATNGNDFLVVWQDDRSESDLNIIGTRVSGSTQDIIDTDGITISDAPHDQTYPAIASNGQDYLVTWQDFRNGLDFDIYTAWVSSEDGSTRTVGNNNGLVQGDDRSQVYPAITHGEDGFLIAWQDESIASNHNIFGVFLDETGTASDEVFTISIAANHQHQPAVASQGPHYVVVWEDHRNEENSSIYARMFDSTSEADEPPEAFPLIEGPGNHRRPQVAAIDRHFVVLWESESESDSLKIGSAVLSVEGEVTSATRPFADGLPTPSPTQLSLAGTAFNLFAVWQHQVSETTNQLRGSRLDSAGNRTADDELELSQNPGINSFQPAVAIEGPQSLIVYEKTSSNGLSRIGARFVESNIPPRITASDGAAEFIEGSAPIPIDANIQIADPDSPNFESGTLRVEIKENRDPNDRLGISTDAENDISVTGNTVRFDGLPIGIFTGGHTTSSPLVFIFTAEATAQTVQQLARSLTFGNQASPPSTLVRTIEITIEDGDDGKSAPAFRNINIHTVSGPPVIVTHPKGGTLSLGDSFVLSVQASGSTPFSYQWVFNGDPIPAEINQELTIDNATVDRAGEYQVIVRNDKGEVTSQVAQLTFLSVERCVTWDSAPESQYYVEGKRQDDDPFWISVSNTIIATNRSTQFCVPIQSPFKSFRVRDGEAPTHPSQGVAVRAEIREDTLCLNWRTDPYANYTVEGRKEITDESWTVVGEFIAGSLPTTQWCTGLDSGFRFFRTRAIRDPAIPPFLVIDSIQRTETGVRLEWTGDSNNSFRVQYTETPSVSSWQTFEETITSPDGHFHYIDRSTPARTSRFYRVLYAK